MYKLYLCNFSVIFLIIIFVPRISQKETPPTLSVDDRVKVLKYQLAQQIRQKHGKFVAPTDDKEDYQYVDVANKPITPINEFDERKKDDKFRLPELVTKPTTTDFTIPSAASSKPIERMKKRKRVKKKKKRQMIKPVDTFYRRGFSLYDQNLYYRNLPNLHCQDLMGPIITGQRKNVTTHHIGFVNAYDSEVKRVIYLFSKNTTNYEPDELTQMLYQISNLKVRLYEWKAEAVERVLTLFLGPRNHGFQSLKLALEGVIKNWNLDLSNRTAFVTQARIYRPPCVKITGYEGSTKSSSGIRYSKLTTPKSTCVTKKGQLDCEYEYDDIGK